MSHHLKLSSALTALLLLCFTVPALAQPSAADPGAIAERCITHITADADRCVTANAAQAENTVERVEALLEEDKPRAARAVAHDAIDRINRRSKACVGHIRMHRDRCVGLLRELGAFEEAQAVIAATRENVEKIAESRRAAVAAIRAAFGDPSTDG